MQELQQEHNDLVKNSFYSTYEGYLKTGAWLNNKPINSMQRAHVAITGKRFSTTCSGCVIKAAKFIYNHMKNNKSKIQEKPQPLTPKEDVTAPPPALPKIQSAKKAGAKKTSFSSDLFDGDMEMSKEVVPFINKVPKGGKIVYIGSSPVISELARHFELTVINDTNHNRDGDNGYDLSKDDTLDEYDLLIIDGPSANGGGKRAGLAKYLTIFDSSKPVLIDDTHRKDERELLAQIKNWKGTANATEIKSLLKTAHYID